MKVKGAEITEISHSPSGQVVAHVIADDGHSFLMPFGLPCALPDIIRGVEAEVASTEFVKSHAARLHSQLVKPPKPPMPVLPWYRKFWEVVSWYFRRSV